MKIKNLVSIIISIIVIFISSILLFSLVEYYDLESFILVGGPLIIITRFADLCIRDFITRERHKQVLVSTFITTLLLVVLFAAGYFVYTNVLGNIDIYKVVIESFNITSLLKYVK